MAYVSIQDIAASWDHYERCVAALLGPLAPGLVLYLAGPTDEGYRIVAIWEGRASFERFHAQRLGPVLTSGQEPISLAWRLRELSAAHVVLGTAQPIAQPLEELSW